jgi:predicted PurR-regulated permease PerM
MDTKHRYSKKMQLGFLFSIITVALVVNFFIFAPFVITLLMAGLFAMTLLPVYVILTQKLFHKKWAGALMTLVFFLIVILAPLVAMGGIFFQEVHGFYVTLTEQGGLFVHVENVQTSLGQPFAVLFPDADFALQVSQTLEQGLDTVLQKTTTIFSSIAHGGLQIIIFCLAFFYILTHAEYLRKAIIAMTPMEKEHTLRIIGQVKQSVYGVMQEIVFLFLMRFFAMMILFSVFGIPNPIFWSMIGALVAVIPGIGMIIAILAATIFLMVSGLPGLGIVLLIIGIFFVVLIESIVGPKLIEHKLRVHPFLILLSMIGGILAFGLPGFFIGPVSLGLLGVLVDEYPTIYSHIARQKDT